MPSPNHQGGEAVPGVVHDVVPVREVVDDDQDLGQGLPGLRRLELLDLGPLLVEDPHQRLLVPLREQAVLLHALDEVPDGVPGRVDLHGGAEHVQALVDRLIGPQEHGDQGRRLAAPRGRQEATPAGTGRKGLGRLRPVPGLFRWTLKRHLILANLDDKTNQVRHFF